jgi:hypothetical protein
MEKVKISEPEFWILHTCGMHDCFLIQDKWKKLCFEFWANTSDSDYVLAPPFKRICDETMFDEAILSLLDKGYLFKYNSDYRQAIRLLFFSPLVHHTESLPHDNEIGISPLGLVVIRRLEILWGIKEETESEYPLPEWFTFCDEHGSIEEYEIFSFTEIGIKDSVIGNEITIIPESFKEVGPFAVRWWELFANGYRAMAVECDHYED